MPITFQELEQASDDSDGPDIAVDLLLCRPGVWVNNEVGTPGYGHLSQETSSLFLHYLMMAINGSHYQRAPGLLAAACHGLGTAFVTETWHIMAAHAMLCTWPTYALLKNSDQTPVPAMIAELLEAARYTAGLLDPIDRPDPLKTSSATYSLSSRGPLTPKLLHRSCFGCSQRLFPPTVPSSQKPCWKTGRPPGFVPCAFSG